jgi:hypothetical protein
VIARGDLGNVNSSEVRREERRDDSNDSRAFFGKFFIGNIGESAAKGLDAEFRASTSRGGEIDAASLCRLPCERNTSPMSRALAGLPTTLTLQKIIQRRSQTFEGIVDTTDIIYQISASKFGYSGSSGGGSSSAIIDSISASVRPSACKASRIVSTRVWCASWTFFQLLARFSSRQNTAKPKIIPTKAKQAGVVIATVRRAPYGLPAISPGTEGFSVGLMVGSWLLVGDIVGLYVLVGSGEVDGETVGFLEGRRTFATAFTTGRQETNRIASSHRMEPLVFGGISSNSRCLCKPNCQDSLLQETQESCC